MALPAARVAQTGAATGESAAPLREVEIQLYAKRKEIYPRQRIGDALGRFQKWRWALVWATQIVFYGLPWLQWNGRQALLFDLAREVNRLLAEGTAPTGALTAAETLIAEFGGTVLGIIPPSLGPAAAGDGLVGEDLIQFIIELRKDARAQKLWGMSDRIRDGLAGLGIVLEDKKEGTAWRRTR